jgi:hypothetical protein
MSLTASLELYSLCLSSHTMPGVTYPIELEPNHL